ncbi:MAG TPA: hypothetical protein VI875_00495 [Candidatus Norongarragalinales archaeon]|nr:hypothetical protein [Candidatus Norongarragalinales archaeon]
MRASTLGLFLFALAGLSLLSGFEWLFFVFIALGLALFVFYKDAVQAPRQFDEAPKQSRTPPPQQVVVIQQEDRALGQALADELVEEIKLEHMIGRGKKLHKEIEKVKQKAAGDTAALKKELAALKKKLDEKKN